MEEKVKKLLLALTILAAVSGTSFAFDLLSYPPPVKGGNILVDLGIGMGFGYSGNMSIPALAVNVEYALPVNVPISVGGAFGIIQYKSDYGLLTDTWTDTWTYTTVGIKGNWHWGFNVSWLDFYSGLFLGYQFSNRDIDGYTGSYAKNSSSFSPGGQIGAHFYFTRNIGAALEFGTPFSKVGLALKF
jgi:hypothetical protein